MVSASLDYKLNALLQQFPVLADEDFLQRYPQVIAIAQSIDKISREAARNHGRCNMLANIGVKTVAEYLSLLNENDPKAVGLYKEVMRTTLELEAAKRQRTTNRQL